MNALLIIFYVLIFPGFLFSAAVGLLLMGIEIQVYDLLKRRRGLSIFQPYRDLLKLFAESRKEWVKVWKQPPFILLLFGLIGTASIPMFIPLFKYVWVGNTADIVIIMYLMIIAVIALFCAGFSILKGNMRTSLIKRIEFILYVQLLVSIILLITAGNAGYSLGGGITFSLNKISSYQVMYGLGIAKWKLIPAAVSFILLIPVIIASVPFNIAELETKAEGEDENDIGSTHIIIYKLTQSIEVFVMALLFTALFLGGSGIHLTGVFAVDMICNIILLILIGALIITAIGVFIRYVTERFGDQRIIRFYRAIPSVLVFISLIFVYLRI